MATCSRMAIAAGPAFAPAPASLRARAVRSKVARGSLQVAHAGEAPESSRRAARVGLLPRPRAAKERSADARPDAARIRPGRPLAASTGAAICGASMRPPERREGPGTRRSRPKRSFSIVHAASTVTEETWEEQVLKSPVPVLVDYWAPWCGPCRMIAPLVDEISTEYGDRVRVVSTGKGGLPWPSPRRETPHAHSRAAVSEDPGAGTRAGRLDGPQGSHGVVSSPQLKLNTDESPKVASEYGIRSIPTVMIFKNGKKLDTVIGAVPKVREACAARSVPLGHPGEPGDRLRFQQVRLFHLFLPSGPQATLTQTLEKYLD